MLAFSEEDIEKAKVYYLAAIQNLQHIKYYYVEAIYFYAKFLLIINDKEGLIWAEKGLHIAQENLYNVLNHKINCLIKGTLEEYKEETFELPIDLILDKLINKNKNNTTSQKKLFNNNIR
jgi:hypothetical protein